MATVKQLFERPTILPLADDEVHTWCVPLNQPADTMQMLARTLSVDEQTRCARFHFERDQRAFVASHGLLRAILGRYLNIEPSRVRFSYGSHGKPALVDSHVRFNLSHAHQRVLIAITRTRAIGADIEHIRPMEDMEQIVARFFSPSERVAFCALPASQKSEAFFSGWTRKEAHLKAIGDGLARPLDSFDVSLAPGAPASLLRVESDAGEAARWSLLALAPVPGYLAALCVEGHNWHLVCQQPIPTVPTNVAMEPLADEARVFSVQGASRKLPMSAPIKGCSTTSSASRCIEMSGSLGIGVVAQFNIALCGNQTLPMHCGR